MSNPLHPAARRQRTLRATIATRGIGIHGGQLVSLRLIPAAPDTGITFVRRDLAGAPELPARWDRVGDTRLCTVLVGDGGASVGTIEHLMAALAAAGIDNLRIELDGAEVPILDGSAAPWLCLLEHAGIVEQPAPRQLIRVRRTVRVHDGDKWALLQPAPNSRWSVSIDFPDAVIGHQQRDFTLTMAGFRRDIAAARTFGFMRDIAALQAQGLARGGSLDNAVVIGEHGVMNAGGLRFADEFVRHKLLDAIGDLYLAGAPIRGRLIANRPGHALNNALLHALFADAEAWEYVPDLRVPPRVLGDLARAA